jgi:hypothetical protein
VKAVISDVFARWGKRIEWSLASSSRTKHSPASSSRASSDGCHSLPRTFTCSPHSDMRGGSEGAGPGITERDHKLADPFGNPIPRLNL